MKTITLENKTWQKLYRLKGDLFAKNYSELIEKLLKIATKIQLASELKKDRKK